ncbi:ABC transporter substrate-binding protein [Brachybacterium sp. NPDC056505]|uniref:ABC transporter substrate-binding protein n=1 Tax=Brachybacterium sp. NPDC056505 TaxID=3345843 RepID=UPI0036729777
MRRRSFLAAGALGLAGMTSACGTTETGSASDLQFFNDAASWEPGYRAAGDALRRRTGWGLSPQTIPNASSYEQVIRSLLQTKNPPDLVKWGSGYRMKDLARTGSLADLGSAWDSSVAAGWLDDDMRQDFTYDGGIYGMPLIQGYYAMFYNLEVFARLGLEAPGTWDEFLAVCRALKKGGVTPIGTTQMNIWPVANWFSMLASAYDTDWYRALCRNEASFLDDRAVGLMELWQSMIRDGLHTSADSVGDNFPSMLANGRIGMQPTPVSWSTQSMELAGMAPGTGFDAFLLPAVQAPSPTVVTEIAGLVVPDRSRHRAEATEALASWLSPKVQEPWSDFLNGSSANPKVTWSDPMSQRIKETILGEGFEVVNRYWENSPPPLVVGVTQDLGGFMADPSDPRGVLESLQRKAESEWSYWQEATR